MFEPADAGVGQRRREPLFAGEVRGFGGARDSHIARQRSEAAQAAVRVAQRADRDHRPEPRAVPSQPPTFGAMDAVVRGLRQRLRRHAERAILRREEVLEPAAQHIGRGVAVEAMGARVPIHDAA